ncbi:hypothetical protein IMSAGC020_01847 [Lachnospiraceae bacterium]|jgi:hypothetical protein|nr:hypothetical protein IMSAGC020_01847 [Lachnospiraceae bacterium]
MKIVKGQPGYIHAQKKRYLIWTIAEFAVVTAVFILGYVQTNTKNNLFTIIAAVGCLPAAKMLVEFIVLYPHHGIEREKYLEIEEKAPLIMRFYDLAVSGTQKIMPIDAIVVSGNVVCGYTSSEKTDENIAAQDIKKALADNRYEKMTVKIFHNYAKFLSRVEGMNSIASVEQPEDLRREQNIRNIIFQISM